MYIDNLIILFEEAISKYEISDPSGLRNELERGLESRKYDLQDEAMIETILKEDRDELLESFTDAIDRVLGERGMGAVEYLTTEEGKREAVRVYITSLEHMINFYYNSLVGKHFSST